MFLFNTNTSTDMEDSTHNYTEEQQLLLTIITECNQAITGRRKLMKLVFLTEHYNTNTNSAEPTPQLGVFTDFVITTSGVTSHDVITTYKNLKNNNLITEDRPSRLNLMSNTNTIKLTETAREHFNPQNTRFTSVTDTITILGADDGDTLHNFSLFLLGLSSNNYRQHIADDIQTILKS